MSKMIPPETVAAFRSFNNVAVDLYGITCTLYVPANPNTVDNLDIYATPQDYVYTEYANQLVYIEWKPDQYRLRKLGLYIEKAPAPVIGWFKSTWINGQGAEVERDIVIGSYIKVNIEYIPSSYDTDEFDITEVIIKNMHDAVAVRAYKLAPRRVK